MSTPEQRVWIIVPVFNNATTLDVLTDGLMREIRAFSDRAEGGVLFINDASADDSGIVIDQLTEKYGSAIGQITHHRNLGQVQAILTGLKAVPAGNAAIIISADMQDPPEVAGQLLQAVDRCTDLIIAARIEHGNAVSRGFHQLIHFFYREYPATGFDVAYLSPEVIAELVRRESPSMMLQVEMLKAARSLKVVRYHKENRPVGASQWSLGKRLEYGVFFLLKYTWIPYALAGIAVAAVLAVLWMR